MLNFFLIFLFFGLAKCLVETDQNPVCIKITAKITNEFETKHLAKSLPSKSEKQKKRTCWGLDCSSIAFLKLLGYEKLSEQEETEDKDFENCCLNNNENTRTKQLVIEMEMYKISGFSDKTLDKKIFRRYERRLRLPEKLSRQKFTSVEGKTVFLTINSKSYSSKNPPLDYHFTTNTNDTQNIIINALGGMTSSCSSIVCYEKDETKLDDFMLNLTKKFQLNVNVAFCTKDSSATGLCIKNAMKDLIYLHPKKIKIPREVFDIISSFLSPDDSQTIFLAGLNKNLRGFCDDGTRYEKGRQKLLEHQFVTKYYQIIFYLLAGFLDTLQFEPIERIKY